MKKSELAWINVSDMEKAKKLFVDLLGMEIKDDQPHWGWLEVEGPEGGSRLGIAQAKEGAPEDPACSPTKPGQNAVVSFSVDNLDQVRTLLEGRGVNFIGETVEIPDQIKMATFLDEDKNVFQLVQSI